MTHIRSFHRILMRAGIVALAAWPLTGSPPPVRAEGPPPKLVIASPEAADPPRPFPARGTLGRSGSGQAGNSGGWWFGTAGIVLALAVFGGISLASRRFAPQTGAGGFLGVVGRSSLSPKHTVYLLKVGERVLIVGTGPQGAPNLLGELTEPDELERFSPRRPAPAPIPNPVLTRRTLDRQVGEAG